MRAFLLLGVLAVFFVSSAGHANESRPSDKEVSIQSEIADLMNDTVHVANLSCGIAPIPPIGCKVGACVCDQYGSNCQWTFILTDLRPV